MMAKLPNRICLLFFLLLSSMTTAFIVPCKRVSAGSPHLEQPQFTPTTTASPLIASRSSTSSLKRSSTQLNGGLFGLGFGEIFLILVGIGVVLGPEKIKELIRSSASTAGDFKSELSKVPEEFQKGLEEGEIEARSRKAKEVTAEKIGVSPDKNDTPSS